ncbi:hypothetical protein PSV08DRAFT_403366 [Bipolaris maydis]|uniref:uncharacterized protein n=1 Tax=Cochliobolus heterostrophus TaxID=5016 RepID=UPI0024D1A321|nr:hypothetical protein J3E73DRAFT_425753 [Bipolaris maydis]KAJ5058346.1 hypothetical protein J3E74DRAFT_476199 [Bipolaris maydis]KAJ6269082.1 hypothetical protein PSV08DRAFT_403366 [Bipolaris maydis]KAJ6279893.1 hypothetical protein J3E71DRAFT_400974 [Bipolaris maydis]
MSDMDQYAPSRRLVSQRGGLIDSTQPTVHVPCFRHVDCASHPNEYPGGKRAKPTGDRRCGLPHMDNGVVLYSTGFCQASRPTEPTTTGFLLPSPHDSSIHCLSPRPSSLVLRPRPVLAPTYAQHDAHDAESACPMTVHANISSARLRFATRWQGPAHHGSVHAAVVTEPDDSLMASKPALATRKKNLARLVLTALARRCPPISSATRLLLPKPSAALQPCVSSPIPPAFPLSILRSWWAVMQVHCKPW